MAVVSACDFAYPVTPTAWTTGAAPGEAAVPAARTGQQAAPGKPARPRVQRRGLGPGYQGILTPP
ncbi:hypothetical protein GCM10010232_62230 [Streptomyces amakusaensis]